MINATEHIDGNNGGHVTEIRAEAVSPIPAAPVRLTDGGRVRIAGVFDRHLGEGLHPGAGVAVYFDGELAVDLVGGMMLGRHPNPVDANTLLRVFSCSKPVAAAAFG